MGFLAEIIEGVVETVISLIETFVTDLILGFILPILESIGIGGTAS
jgi:hypothetical protein